MEAKVELEYFEELLEKDVLRVKLELELNSDEDLVLNFVGVKQSNNSQGHTWDIFFNSIKAAEKYKGLLSKLPTK